MWICPRCHSENREAASVCESCGSARSAGRFGSAPQQRRMQSTPAPRVTTPAPREQREQDMMPRSAVRGEYPVPEMDPPRPKRVRRPAVALAKIVGTLLCVLLPILTGLLAWRQYGVLYPALTGLLVAEDTAAWQGMACYITLSVLAGLLSLLPGLWTLLFARMAQEKR